MKGSALRRRHGGTVRPAQRSAVTQRARPEPVGGERDLARWSRHGGRDRDHLDHGLRPRQAPQALSCADHGPRRARPQRKRAVGDSLASLDACHPRDHPGWHLPARSQRRTTSSDGGGRLPEAATAARATPSSWARRLLVPGPEKHFGAGQRTGTTVRADISAYPPMIFDLDLGRIHETAVAPAGRSPNRDHQPAPTRTQGSAWSRRR